MGAPVLVLSGKTQYNANLVLKHHNNDDQSVNDKKGEMGVVTDARGYIQIRWESTKYKQFVPPDTIEYMLPPGTVGSTGDVATAHHRRRSSCSSTTTTTTTPATTALEPAGTSSRRSRRRHSTATSVPLQTAPSGSELQANVLKKARVEGERSTTSTQATSKETKVLNRGPSPRSACTSIITKTITAATAAATSGTKPTGTINRRKRRISFIEERENQSSTTIHPVASVGFCSRPLTMDLTLDSSSDEVEETSEDSHDDEDDKSEQEPSMSLHCSHHHQEEEKDNDVHKVSVTSPVGWKDETMMERAFEQMSLNFESRIINSGGPRTSKSENHDHHHHPAADDEEETAARADGRWQQWDTVSELTDPEADDENMGPYSLSEFLTLVKVCEDFNCETACEIEQSQRFRGSNTVVSPGDSVSQCKAQYGRLLPGAMQVGPPF
jgi:hypothetical protein